MPLMLLINKLLMNKSFMKQQEHVPEAVPLVLLMNESFTKQHGHVPATVPLMLLMNKLFMNESSTVLVLLMNESFNQLMQHIMHEEVKRYTVHVLHKDNGEGQWQLVDNTTINQG